jgi:futalosine hydrolase
MDLLSEAFRERAMEHGNTLHLCGFGPIVSGIRTTQLLQELGPSRVVLFGIAGSYAEDLTVGTCVEFSEVGCYGVGAGTGREFMTNAEMGWDQWSSKSESHLIRNVLSLSSIASNTKSSQLLTCCSASAGSVDVQWRKSKFPNAIAEDMEGFAVAAACTMHNVPLHVLRGISNVAGNRNLKSWKIRDAMMAVEHAIAKFIPPASIPLG